MKSKIIFNGKILNQQDIQFNTIKRAINFGDGFFETIRIVNGDVLFIESHLKRIFKALKILKISNSENFNSEIIKAKIKELLLHNKIDSGGRVKIYFFRSGLGTYLPITNEISFIIECFHLENNLYQLNKKGFLVYIVCSFHPFETVEVIDKIMQKHKNIKLHNINSDKMIKRQNGYFINPLSFKELGGSDIFFISVLEKLK